MKYPCLVVDHDDTVVNSTATVHYPSFVEYASIYHPDAHYTLEDYFKYNFDPGVVAFFRDMVGMTHEDMLRERRAVRRFTFIFRQHPARLPRKRSARAGHGIRLGAPP